MNAEKLNRNARRMIERLCDAFGSHDQITETDLGNCIAANIASQNLLNGTYSVDNVVDVVVVFYNNSDENDTQRKFSNEAVRHACNEALLKKVKF